jgi:hypothetical protein
MRTVSAMFPLFSPTLVCKVAWWWPLGHNMLHYEEPYIINSITAMLMEPLTPVN